MIRPSRLSALFGICTLIEGQMSTGIGGGGGTVGDKQLRTVLLHEEEDREQSG